MMMKQIKILHQNICLNNLFCEGEKTSTYCAANDNYFSACYSNFRCLLQRLEDKN